MKTLLVLLGFFGSLASASCPDLNGLYKFENEWNGTIEIKQTGCEHITLIFDNNRYIAKFHPDGKRYAKNWDDNMNSDSNLPVTAVTPRFDQASYSADRFVWKNFEGPLAKCEGKYSYTSFDCQEFEHSFGYDVNAKAFTWTQIAFWRGADGRYEQSEFLLKKIR